MDPITYIATIATLVSSAKKVWTKLDTFNSADRDLQDHEHEINLLTAEFKSLSTLFRSWTDANRLPAVSSTLLRKEDFTAGLVRFQDGLRRVENIMANVKKGKGNFGRVVRGYRMLLKDKELTRLKGHIASIREHLQIMLHVRESYLIELIATEVLQPHSTVYRRGSVASQFSLLDTISVDRLPSTSTSAGPNPQIMSPPPSPTDLEGRISNCRSDFSSLSSAPSHINLQERWRSLPTSCVFPRPSISRPTLEPPPSPPPSPPPNPPPILNYKGLERVVHLKELLPRRFPKKISLSGISPSGDIIALLSETHFAIFKHKSLEFIGDLSQGKVGSGQLEKKKTCAIKTIALNQEYLFAAADSRILVFAIDAVSRGTLCHVCDIGAEKTIDKFVMSSDGSTLLVLAKISTSFQFAQMYSASLELDQFTEHFVPTDNIDWNDCERIHRNGTFSADGNKIAIYTSHCRQGNVEIRFLQKKGHRWRQYREPLIAKVLSDDADAQLGEKGITGLAIIHNKYVAWSVDSTLKDPHSWCDLDDLKAPASKLSFGRPGARIVEMNPSNTFGAIVQIDKGGNLHFKQHIDPSRFPAVDELHILLERAEGVKATLSGPRSMSFTKDGGEFLLLTDNCDLEIYRFKTVEES